MTVSSLAGVTFAGLTSVATYYVSLFEPAQCVVNPFLNLNLQLTLLIGPRSVSATSQHILCRDFSGHHQYWLRKHLPG